MRNIFELTSEFDAVYDLKGSLYKRRTNVKEDKGPLKDLNFLENKTKFFLKRNDADFFKSQIKKDTDFLNQYKIIDYSLLVGMNEKKNKNLRISNWFKLKNILDS